MNRQHADALIVSLLKQPSWFWQDLEDTAVDAGLDYDDALQAAYDLHAFYGAVRMLPISRMIQIVPDGLVRYQEDTP